MPVWLQSLTHWPDELPKLRSDLLLLPHSRQTAAGTCGVNSGMPSASELELPQRSIDYVAQPEYVECQAWAPRSNNLKPFNPFDKSTDDAATAE